MIGVTLVQRALRSLRPPLPPPADEEERRQADAAILRAQQQLVELQQLRNRLHAEARVLQRGGQR